MNNNVLALKNLAVAVLGGGLKVEDIKCDTIAGVINYIAEHYTAPTAE